MLPLPSREALARVTHAANAIVPLQSLGFVSSLDDARVTVLFVHGNGVSQDVLQRPEVPTVLRPSIDEAHQFLKAMFNPLLMMLTWWLNRKDEEGKGIFGGGHQTGWTALVALLIQCGGQLSFGKMPVEAVSRTREGKVA